MKNLKNLFVLAFFSFTILSCQKEQPVPAEFDFEAFRNELKNDESYTAYIDARETFYLQMENGEFDFLNAYSHLRTLGIRLDCGIDPSVLDGYHGGEKLLKSYCDIMTSLRAFQSNHDLSSLSEDEKIVVLDYRPEPNGVEGRVIDCLVMFSFHMTLAIGVYTNCLDDAEAGTHEQIDESWCDGQYDSNVNYAATSYDSCCNGGGSGCP